MKAKTIKLILRSKIDQWLATVEDEDLRKIMKRDVIVTGGCIASMLIDEKVNDFDVYFKTYEATLRVAHYYLNHFEPKKKRGIECKMIVADENKQELSATHISLNPNSRVQILIKSAGVASEDGANKPYQYFESQPSDEAGEYINEVMEGPAAIEDAYEDLQDKALESTDEKRSYRPVFLSTNAITLSDRIQIVLRFWGEPDHIHENYDFAHCMNYWTSQDNKLVLRPEALEALITKELRYVGSKYPVCSLIRIRKFIKRGFTINAGQVLKMILQVSELNLKDINVLEDQLTGVDAAYFAEVIYKMREKDPENINSAYLIEIIDRMF